jgi:class 3 adenylate cyclase/tetratricopeptide (TPR) repeat protein
MACQRCGSENPDGFRFCGACGAPLAPDVGSDVGHERKVISAVFCDLVGFTSRAEVMDPEDVHRMLRAYYASVRGEFERWGGSVAKYIGDAVFVVYGAPRAHEDDPERAVRAALCALDAVADLNAREAGLDLHVHIGVTTGEALITRGPRPDESGGLAWGDILNTAARLEAAADPDTILVDDPTYRATRRVIKYEPAEAVLAKGKAEPVPAWRPTAPIARRGLTLADAGEHPLVDRGAELTLLMGMLDGVRSSRAPQLVTIVGEPGIGKSRIVFELFRRIDEGLDLINFRLGRSPPHPEGISFWALGEIVKAQAGMLATDGAATAAGKLHTCVRDLIPALADGVRVEGHLRSLVGLGEPSQARGDQRGAAFAAWRHFLEALARQRPLVLVFEDLQWADDGLLDFIEHLVAWANDVALMVVATARTELLERHPRWGESNRATKLVLDPFSEQDSRDLIAALAGEGALSAELTDAVVDSASGNPLYSVEFVRMLTDRGLLIAARRHPVAPPALAPPPSVRGIIASRLDSLSAEDKAVLQAGAVIGRAMWPGALSAVTGRPRRWIVSRLSALEQRAFIRRIGQSSVEREDEYRFQHVLIRDVAYSEIPRRRRGDIHGRTAQWLESLSPDRATDRAEMLAHHYLCAYELAEPHDAAALAQRTRRALREAGDRALALHAFPAAARYFQAALDLSPADDPDRPWLGFRLGKSLYYASTAGTEELAAAREALLAAGDRGTAAQAETFLAYLAHHHGSSDEYHEHLDRAAELVGDLGPSEAKAEVLVDLANERAMAREHESAIATATEAREIARALGLRELEASALSMIGVSKGLAGDRSGRDDLQRAIAIMEEIESHLSAHCCGMLADLEHQLGDLGACFALQERARRHAERFGHSGFVRWLAAERVGECYWTGQWDDAVARADAFIAEAETGTPNFMEGYCRAMRGRIRLARGEAAAALDDAARAVEFARSAEDPQTLYPALAFAARAEAVAGSRETGAALAHELLGRWRTAVDANPVSSWAVDLFCAFEAVGQTEELATTARSVTARTRWLDALLCLASGDFVAAAGHFRRIGSRPDEALAHLRAAQALVRAGRADGARAEAGQAEAFFTKVGALSHLRESSAITASDVVTEAPSN